MKQSGKVQVLFWLFFFSIILFVWIVWTALQTFIFGGPRMELPQEQIALIFILYGILILFVLAGTVISVFINNRRYMNRFGAVTLLIFISFLAGKSVFG
ncbi:hypothetical protein NNO_2113 [Hydrogenimonas sp.]|nr:hypothetical protein NNO_2113 [Hydrogenimonas sp.]